MKKADLGARAPNPRPRRRHPELPNNPEERAQAIADLTGKPVTVVTLLVGGRCRVCGCTDDQACELGAGFHCWWVDAAHTLCSSPRCLAVVPIAELEQEAECLHQHNAMTL